MSSARAAAAGQSPGPGVLQRSSLPLHSLPHTNNAHPVVDTVGDIQIPLRVYPTAVGALQAGGRGGSAVAITALVSTGDGSDDAGHGIDAADGVIFLVHHDDVVLMVAADG